MFQLPSPEIRLGPPEENLFKAMGIEEADAVPPEVWEPVYKKKRPKDRAIVCSDGKHTVVMDYIGPAFDYWMESHGVEEGDWDGIPAGIWMCQGHVSTERYFEGDYDCYLNFEYRALSEQEWELWREDKDVGPWKEADWLENPRTPYPDVAPDPVPWPPANPEFAKDYWEQEARNIWAYLEGEGLVDLDSPEEEYQKFLKDIGAQMAKSAEKFRGGL